ncbi:sulfotransferase family protein [Kitasatospora sp. NPDC056800]|uniref:sulfotransferase family protein n=1 Tax=Kitasatospora sp. NPDC056800 TaxID=3345948 RepID=UPI0036BC29F7
MSASSFQPDPSERFQPVPSERDGGRPRPPKVFGLGLTRTGTRSLTAALGVLGFDVVHYPVDGATYRTLLAGSARFPLLESHDGLTDITVVPYYQDLDLAWPGSRFVLTVREEESWLRSCRTHWERPLPDRGDGRDVRLEGDLQRFLRAAVYGCHAFHAERFRGVYRRHVAEVARYFADRADDLLVLDVVGGEGYERLAPFLGVPVPDEPFPHLS